MEPEDPTTYTSPALPVGEVEPDDLSTRTSSALLDDSLESFSSPLPPDPPPPPNSALPTLLVPAGTLYSQQEVTAAEALLLSFAGHAYNMKYATNEAVYFSIRRNYSYQCLPS